MIQNIIPKNNKKQDHGICIYYYKYSGNLMWKGQFINDIQYGYWIDNRFINVNYKSEITFYLK